MKIELKCDCGELLILGKSGVSCPMCWDKKIVPLVPMERDKFKRAMDAHLKNLLPMAKKCRVCDETVYRIVDDKEEVRHYRLGRRGYSLLYENPKTLPGVLACLDSGAVALLEPM